MLRKAALVLAITLASLSAARAEDPDEDVIERLHAAVAHLPAPRHHTAPFSEPQRPLSPN
jgi:hypothetical protein